MDHKKRCGWVEGQFEDYIRYHDEEWGVPVHDNKIHFEFLTLEGAQAGLSWATVLRKRHGYRQAFADFDVEKVARFDEKKIQELFVFDGIIKNKLKIRATVNNAQRFIELQEAYDGFSNYIWQFVNGRPLVNQWRDHRECPATTAESDALSRDLKKRGFKFVGSTIIYAYMQACGLVNDHIIGCFRHQEVIIRR